MTLGNNFPSLEFTDLILVRPCVSERVQVVPSSRVGYEYITLYNLPTSMAEHVNPHVDGLFIYQHSDKYILQP